MAESVRVNLSVPVGVDAVVSQVAEATGRSKAAVVMEAVGYRLPLWKRMLHQQEHPEADAVSIPEASDQPVSGKKPELTRQQRRAQEREQKKAARRVLSDG